MLWLGPMPCSAPLQGMRDSAHQPSARQPLALVFSLLCRRFGTTQVLAAPLPARASVLPLGPCGCCPPLRRSPRGGGAGGCRSLTHVQAQLRVLGGRGGRACSPSPGRALCTSPRALLGWEGWRRRGGSAGGWPCPSPSFPTADALV